MRSIPVFYVLLWIGFILCCPVLANPAEKENATLPEAGYEVLEEGSITSVLKTSSSLMEAGYEILEDGRIVWYSVPGTYPEGQTGYVGDVCPPQHHCEGVPVIYLNEAFRLYKAGDVEKAREFFERALNSAGPEDENDPAVFKVAEEVLVVINNNYYPDIEELVTINNNHRPGSDVFVNLNNNPLPVHEKTETVTTMKEGMSEGEKSTLPEAEYEVFDDGRIVWYSAQGTNPEGQTGYVGDVCPPQHHCEGVPVIYLNEAFRLYKAGDVEKAREFFERALNSAGPEGESDPAVFKVAEEVLVVINNNYYPDIKELVTINNNHRPGSDVFVNINNNPLPAQD